LEISIGQEKIHGLPVHEEWAEKQRAEKGIKRDPLEFSCLVRLAARAEGKR
jgi:hypothetical protein